MNFYLRAGSGDLLPFEIEAPDVAAAVLAPEAENLPAGTRLICLATNIVHAIASDGGWTISLGVDF